MNEGTRLGKTHKRPLPFYEILETELLITLIPADEDRYGF
jgi:hypothetical protein